MCVNAYYSIIIILKKTLTNHCKTILQSNSLFKANRHNFHLSSFSLATVLNFHPSYIELSLSSLVLSVNHTVAQTVRERVLNKHHLPLENKVAIKSIVCDVKYSKSYTKLYTFFFKLFS